ncbi:hypothetical protein [uncultured Deinococcus sp.]|uniref:hypothetical protein n=1 Tax=uncultured Deinococcus sp. TaxID=158789 RepID=UPI0025FDF96F|nr:hypothetical protein [uncultured Deinococcus sp.]
MTPRAHDHANELQIQVLREELQRLQAPATPAPETQAAPAPAGGRPSTTPPRGETASS